MTEWSSLLQPPQNSFPLLLPELWAFKVLSVRLTMWMKGELICLHFYSSEKVLVRAAEASWPVTEGGGSGEKLSHLSDSLHACDLVSLGISSELLAKQTRERSWGARGQLGAGGERVAPGTLSECLSPSVLAGWPCEGPILLPIHMRLSSLQLLKHCSRPQYCQQEGTGEGGAQAGRVPQTPGPKTWAWARVP